LAFVNYRAPAWLPGGNLQTIWPALYSRRVLGPAPQYRRERWTSPDDDFIDVDWLAPQGESDASSTSTHAAPGVTESTAGRPLLVLFHGLEGSSSSHYALAFADFARERGAAFAVAHFRGCSGELNYRPRAYHSGDFEEIDWILRRFRRVHHGAVVAVGVSLGGNALMRWAGEMQGSAASLVGAVASVSAPLDLAAGGAAIGRGFNRMVYTPMFLNTMKPKALEKLSQHPGLFDRDALMAARDLHAFDNIFTAPLHGFRNTDDYWTRASAKPLLASIKVPALVVNALNDPFVPASSLPTQKQVSARVQLWQPSHGGHVGFASGRLPGHVRTMPDAVGGWLLEQVVEQGRLEPMPR
jgi:predicted alpha/beta-fold hydrolase